MKRRSFILFLFTLFASVLFAQEPKFVASAGRIRGYSVEPFKTIAVGEQFQVTFALNTNGNNFRGPSFSDFSVYMGPSTSTSMQIINGSMSQQISFSYIVAAAKEGTFTIGPASITVGGKTIYSNSLKIEVTKSTAPQNNTQGGIAGDGSKGDNMFIRTILSRSKCYQGEYLLVTHKVYSRDRIVGFRDLDYPAYEGFWSQVLEETKQNIQLDQENIDGTIYYVATLRQALLFPQHSGTIEVKPMSVEMIVRQKTKSTGDDFWDSFFGTSYKDADYKIKGSPAKVEVMALPENGKPESFSNSVGTFSISARTDKAKAKTNDAINLTITVSGKGNLKMIEPPKVNIPPDIESYDPKSSESVSISANGMTGTRTFEYVMIPRHAGGYKISVEPFSYFDPEKNAYTTLASSEFDLSVEKGAQDAGTTVISPTQKEEVKEIASDIRYIKPGMKTIKERGEFFFRSVKYWAVTAFPAVIFFALVLIRRKKERDEADAVSLKSRRAGRLAQKRLAGANTLLMAGKKDQFYEEVLRAMNAYVSERLNLPVSELSRDRISMMFAGKNISPEITGKLISIIDTCEFARYAPSGSAVEMGNMYNDSLETIIRIEETLS